MSDLGGGYKLVDEAPSPAPTGGYRLEDGTPLTPDTGSSGHPQGASVPQKAPGFWESVRNFLDKHSSGQPTLMDRFSRGVSGRLGDPNGPDPIEGLVSGVGHSLGRTTQAWHDAFTGNGNLNTLAEMVPLLGPAAVDAVNNPDKVEGAGNIAGLVVPTLLHDPVIAAKLQDAAERTAAVSKGTVKGAVNAATDVHRVKLPKSVSDFTGLESLPVNRPLAGAGLGAGLGYKTAGNTGAVVGGLVGGAYPIVKGAIDGGRNALTDLVRSRQGFTPLQQEIMQRMEALKQNPPAPKTPVPAPAPQVPPPAVLPSGRVPGGIANQAPPAPPEPLTPLQQEILRRKAQLQQQPLAPAAPAPTPALTAPPVLPSGRIPGGIQNQVEPPPAQLQALTPQQQNIIWRKLELQRRAAMAPQQSAPASAPVEPILPPRGILPSGRMIGPDEATPAPPAAPARAPRTPAWMSGPGPAPRAIPAVEPIRPATLPSGRTVGNPLDALAQASEALRGNDRVIVQGGKPLRAPDSEGVIRDPNGNAYARNKSGAWYDKTTGRRVSGTMAQMLDTIERKRK